MSELSNVFRTIEGRCETMIASNPRAVKDLVVAAMGPDEKDIAMKLKAKLSNEGNGFTMLAEFDRYLDLIQLPKVHELLRLNREKLFFALLESVDKYREQIDKGTFANSLYNSSVTLDKIFAVNHMKNKLEHVQHVSTKILQDMQNIESLEGKLKYILKELYTEEKACITEWAEGLKASIKRDEISMKEEDKVIEFSEGSRQMEVTYNPQLSKISEETQQLLIMGYEIPDIIIKLVTKAKKFSKQARELDQIATFHNTIGDRMIPSQRPMMLEMAIALSKMVGEQNDVVWSNTKDVQQYINALKSKVTDLARSNGHLSTLHIKISQKVKSLYDADLIKQPLKWKEVLKETRDIFKDVERDGYKNRKSWEIHWDRQLYKVLEVQYILCMSTLNENLSELSVELVYRQERLQFQPPLEELKTLYYNNVRKLINIPRDFRGISEEEKEESIFTQIIKRHHGRYEKVFIEGERLFEQLVELQDRFVEWISYGIEDVENLGKNVLQTPEDWDKSLKQAKARGQDIVKLNCADEKVGCFVVSFKLLRFEIELLNRKNWEVLVALLNSRIIHDMASFNTFLKDGIEKLGVDPKSLEEIAKANLSKEEICKAIPSMKELLESIEGKNKVLITWTKEKFDISRLKSSWERLMSLVDNHQNIIGRQVDNIKTKLKVEALSLINEIDDFRIRWNHLKPKDSNTTADPVQFDKAIKYIVKMKEEWSKWTEKKDKIMHSFESISTEKIDFDFGSDLDKELASYEQTWNKLAEFRNGIKEFETEDWIIFRVKPYRFEEFLQEWDEKLRLEPNSVFITQVLMDIENYKTIVPNMKYLRGDIFTEKHWYELFNMLGMERKSIGELTLGDFLAVKDKISDNIKELKEMNQRASGEVTVTQALNELDAWEIGAKFQLAENQDSHNTTVYIIQDFKSVLNKIGDNQSLLQSIRTSPYYSHFADRITMWETKLADLDEYLQSLNKIQRRWIYLEPIFSHGVLESEQQRFRRIDEDFRLIMEKLQTDNRVSNLRKLPGIKNRLNMLLDQLSRCQNSLNEFLEKKRSGFPRFYFLGDDDLLEILGQSTKPSVIQAHLKKLFAGIHNVDFDENFQFITAMKSLEGEVVSLKTRVKITSNVEEWLNELSVEMRCTLKSLLLDCVSDNKPGFRDPERYPTQILCLSNNIVFTDQCEEAIRSGKLSSLQVQLKEDLTEYTGVRINENSPGGKLLELKIKDMILEAIHHSNVVDYLIQRKITSVSDWHWQKQLRFYIRNDGGGTATVRMADAEFIYSYEYQGNAPKLVHTPLTDKCYLTLTQGMRMGLGGNPYGPAGTGKTESVKALGSLLGRQVLVFNCDEGIDVKSMGRIFMGLVKCGAWGCFDEFNRLEGATLSAVSMQIQPIQTALKQGAKTVILLDEEVSLDPNTGIFVTLNPAGQGYGGRNKLPDNLKQLFRPVVMSRPDNDRIAEVILYTEGYRHAKKIGMKLVEVFTLSEKLLTRQTHYDWGLRALKTVLKGCGSAMRQLLVQSNLGLSEKTESDIAVSSLRLNTLPKLTYSDCFRFDSLIKDVFHNISFRDLGNDDLADFVRESYVDLKLEINENQVRKCLELYEQLQQRMGVVIVGPPSCGKSTILTILKHAMQKMKMTVKMHIINPKVMPRSCLLGHINLDTRQWTDGILTLKAQQVYSEPPEITSWIVCDGDIDPEWIESLNSVLDDNRLLTLPSGWRIKFGPNVNFIFETHDLSLASPATISRMGMIFMSEEDADIVGLVNSWVSKEDKENQTMLHQLTEDYLHKALAYVSQVTDPMLPLPVVSIVQNALSLMSEVKSISQMALVLIRGLGGHLNSVQLLDLSEKILSWTQQSNTFGANRLNLFYNARSDKLEPYYDDSLLTDGDFELTSFPLVKTADVKRVLDHIKPWLKNQESFMLIGPEGCGKTMILDNAFKELRSTEVAVIYCSSLISPENVLQKLSQICITMTTTTGRVYKSKDGERLILYFKDINLVKQDKWGTCHLVEFLRQIIVYQGFYDKNLEWVTVQGIQIVASISIGNAGGGRYNLSPRFTSRVRICTMNQPENDQLFTICNSYLSVLLKSYFPDHSINKKPKQIESLATGMVKVYTEVRTAFTPVVQSHYQFTPRDLTKWILGLMRYNILQGEKTDLHGLYCAWAFESCRLFRDKLVSREDKKRYDENILFPVLTQWGITNVDQIFTAWVSSLSASVINQQPKHTLSPLLGSTLVQLSKEDLYAMVEKGISIFSRENRGLNVVITPEVIENVVCFDRILSFPCSSMVLAGRAGVGRRTALSIVASLHQTSIVTLKVGRNYNVKLFKNDLKAVIQMSAIEGNKFFLVIEDYQLVDVIFLDMINSLLSSGEIPGLYSQEELDVIMSTLRDVASSEEYNSSIASYFALRVRQMLNVVLIMDYTNEKFIKNCQNNPALYKQCSMVWLDAWGEEAMKMLPFKIIKKFYGKGGTDLCGFGTEFSDQKRKDIFASGFQTIYGSVSKEIAYPRKYISLIHNHAMLYQEKHRKVSEQRNRLEAGVKKLEEASNIVEKLKSDASAQELVLAEKKFEANKALEMMTGAMQTNNLQQREVMKIKEQTGRESLLINEKKRRIDKDLALIEPMVQAARSAVGNLKNESISEIRSLRAPPDIIRDILEGVLRLMGIRDMSWNSMKSFLSKRGVKDEIRNFDARNIDPSDRDAVEKLLTVKNESFEPKNAKRASVAAAPLAEWVTANVRYSIVLENIEPLERQQLILKQNLLVAESHMLALNSELDTVEKRVYHLKVKLNQNTKEAAEIEFHLLKAKFTLDAAEGLVEKLNEEFTRWTFEMQQLDAELKNLPLNTLMAAAFITFLCNAPEDIRVKYVAQWSQELEIDSFDFQKFLSTERDLLHWQSLGLPPDRLSHENAIIILQTCLRPYIVDPSSRATEWLINHLSTDREPIVISLHDAKFTNELELAVRFGKILIIVEADIIEPILVPILRCDLISQGSRDVVQIGDKLVDYNPNFRLFLATRNPHPAIPPDAVATITIINFTTTKAGLLSQLLSTTLSFEKPEIQNKKTELVKNIESLKLQLDQLGESLLQELGTAQGNILENRELLGSLDKTKANSMAIAHSLRESSLIEDSLNKEINMYLPFAEFGSSLYFGIIEASQLNPIYQFSLSSFSSLFEKIFQYQPQNGSNVDKRISVLSSSLLDSIYEYVFQALFKTDRMAFAMHLSHLVVPTAFEKNEWEAFTGRLVGEIKSVSKENIPKWIAEDRRFSVYILSTSFPDLYENLNLIDKELWKEFYHSSECEDMIPFQIKEKLSPFQEVMLIHALRPDRLHTSMYNFLRKSFGKSHLFPPPPSIRQILKDSTSQEPILMLISSGADPSQDIRELAESTIGKDNYVEIPMGQGQTDTAFQKLRQVAEKGHWMCLKNLHLVTHLLDSLEKEIRSLKPHENFRLWLTSEPHLAFPKVLAQSCIKIAFEAPQGIKKNLQRTYASWPSEYVSGGRNVLRSQSLFVLAVFHAVVQERRTYIPQGWSTFYEFNDSDLRAGSDVIEQLFKGSRSKDIQWNYIHGLFESAIYGGRVDNEFDNRVLVTYLLDYFNDSILTGANPSKKTFGPNVMLPNSTNIQDYINVIERIPENDRPSFFGLPSNIEKSWQRVTSSQIIAQLKHLSRTLDATEVFDRNIWIKELTPLLNLWKKLHSENCSTNLLQEKLVAPGLTEKDHDVDPIESFVKLEYHNIVVFMQLIHKVLGSISKVIRGLNMPSEYLRIAADTLIRREIPKEWLKLWEGPHDAVSYLTGLVGRAAAVKKWSQRVQSGELLKYPIDLADLLNPDTFFCAFKQSCARKLSVPMDTLKFACAWDRNTISSDKLCCQLTGLLLEGCSFNGVRLQENESEDLPLSNVVDCTIAWIVKKSDIPIKGAIISVPLYANEMRKKLIGSLDMPSNNEDSKWIKTGIALFLKT